MGEWQNYLETAEKYKDCEYMKFTKTPVSRVKEKWVGGVFCEGDIYGVVNSERKGILIHPETKTYEFFGEAPIGTFKWTGGCCYGDKIYGFPRKENSLLVMDVQTKEIAVREIPTGYRGEHHYGGVCTENGIIYQPPRNCNHILKIDLNTFEVEEIAIADENSKCRYTASVIHPNGDIYMIPERGQRVLVLHPDTDRVEYIGEIMTVIVFGVVVGIDGNIYGFCKDGNGLLKISVQSKSVEMICEEIGRADCYGSVVGVNGKIIGIPADMGNVWEFDVLKQKAQRLFVLEEKGMAKCAGAGVGCDGTICMIPAFGEYIYFVSVDGQVCLPADVMKNRYFNTFY